MQTGLGERAIGFLEASLVFSRVALDIRVMHAATDAYSCEGRSSRHEFLDSVDRPSCRAAAPARPGAVTSSMP